MTKAKIFLTDYASYYHGRQFEFGHWVDLSQFDNADELQKYITNHLREADEKSPLPFGKREDPLINDYEGFPEELYSKSMSLADWKRLFNFLNLLKLHRSGHFDNVSEVDLLRWFLEKF